MNKIAQTMAVGFGMTLLISCPSRAENLSEMDVLYTYACDLSIFDASFDEYFEGSAEAGVEALLNEGKVYINGLAIPGEAEYYAMNGADAIWQEESGNWSWRNFPWVSSERTGEETFEEARKNFLNGVTTARGMRADFLAETGNDTVDAISISIVNSALVDEIIENEDGSYTIAAISATASGENYDTSIEVGDIIIYWEDGDGMHIEQAIAEEGIYHYIIGDPLDDAALMDLIDGEEFIDARMGRTIQSGCRPNQFAQVLERFDIQDNEMIGWWTSTHYLIGLTRTEESARATLEEAIEKAEAGTEGIVVSEDGSDVAGDVYWVDSEVWGAFEEKLAEAKEMLSDEAATSTQMDQMLSELADAYGSETALGDHMSGTKGVQGFKELGSKAE